MSKLERPGTVAAANAAKAAAAMTAAAKVAASKALASEVVEVTRADTRHAVLTSQKLLKSVYAQNLQMLRQVTRASESAGKNVRAVLAGKLRGAVEGEAPPQPTAEPPPSVPPVGELIIAVLCGREMEEAILGDLEEGFQWHVGRRGNAWARAWYWGQVSRSAMSFAWRWVKRVLVLEAVLRRIGL